MRTTSPGCGAIGVRFVITTVTGKGAGPEAGELVDGSGGCVVAGVEAGVVPAGGAPGGGGARAGAAGVGAGLGAPRAAGRAPASASTAPAAPSRGRRRM